MDEVSKRDLFAMAALQGLLACPTTRIKAHDVARQCYQIADAMVHESYKPFDPSGVPIEEPENATA